MLSSDCPSSEYRVTSDLITRQPIELELWARRHTDPPFFSEVHLNYLRRRSCGGDKSHCLLLLFHNNMEEESGAEMCFIRNSEGQLVIRMMTWMWWRCYCLCCSVLMTTDHTEDELWLSVWPWEEDVAHTPPSRLASGPADSVPLTETTIQGSVLPASPLHDFLLFSVVKWL